MLQKKHYFEASSIRMEHLYEETTWLCSRLSLVAPCFATLKFCWRLCSSLLYSEPSCCRLSTLGISGRSQCLFALVFTTRYLDLVTNFVSPYNSVMKVVFLITTYGTIYLVFFKFKATYDSNHDSFRAEFLVIPVAGLAVLVNHEFSVMEVRAEGLKQCKSG